MLSLGSDQRGLSAVMLALVADLARRMAAGESTSLRPIRLPPKQIVLIDEIELHLAPFVAANGAF